MNIWVAVPAVVTLGLRGNKIRIKSNSNTDSFNFNQHSSIDRMQKSVSCGHHLKARQHESILTRFRWPEFLNSLRDSNISPLNFHQYSKPVCFKLWFSLGWQHRIPHYTEILCWMLTFFLCQGFYFYNNTMLLGLTIVCHQVIMLHPIMTEQREAAHREILSRFTTSGAKNMCKWEKYCNK